MRARSDRDTEHSRKMKCEILQQYDGVHTDENDRILQKRIIPQIHMDDSESNFFTISPHSATWEVLKEFMLLLRKDRTWFNSSIWDVHAPFWFARYY